MSRKYKELPQTVTLYWHCQVCDERREWPKHRASLYCSGACKAKAYRRRKKKSQGYALLNEEDFDWPPESSHHGYEEDEQTEEY